MLAFKAPGMCPFCDAERGFHGSGWGMSPEGWAEMKRLHDNGHYGGDRRTFDVQAAVEMQMERVAALKGYAGRLRAAISAAHDILHRQSVRPDGFLSQNERDVDAILTRALEVRAP